jgi:3-oxoacyl-(acyl-carrier-protein) synthase
MTAISGNGTGTKVGGEALAPGQRIVVTGIGLVSPYGAGAPAFFEGIRAGRAALKPIESFDVSGCRCTFGGQVPALDLRAFDDSGVFRRAPRATQYALMATDEALRGAGETRSSWDPERVGVFLGTYRAMTEVSEQIWAKLIKSEPRFVPALLFQETVTNAVASAISIRWGFKGTNYAISSGNASGYQVLQLAVQALRGGRADAVVAGAFDLFTEANQHDMDDLDMLSPSNTSRPFDRRRDGFVMGEGAGVVVLETLDRARARGATVLAEIAGVGLAHDAHGFGSHHPDGRGLAAAVRQALAEAVIEPGDVDYVGAAANSTPGLDRAESRALHAVFGARAGEVPVSGLKAYTGEAMAASDMFNLAAVIAAVGDGVAPLQPEIESDSECALNLAAAGRAPREVRTALADSYSYFGGNAAAVVVRACAA